MGTGADWFIVYFFYQELAVMRRYLTVIFLATSLLLPVVAKAQGGLYSPNRADAFLGDVYLGVKYGRITYAEDVPDFDDGSDTRNLGFMFGKKFNDIIGMEFDYTQTVTEDDTSAGTISTHTLGLFVVGRTPGKVYVKGRLGYMRLTQERNLSPDSFDNNSYGMGWGAGVGINLYKKGSLELEYTVLPDTDDRGFLGVPAGFDFTAETDFVSVNYVWGF